ncbi:hypothetical protein VOA_001822 [Vibrio sp. RC586]|nr:hypothetical protein VOA_001822 [Vibrio sp. RC586]
MEATLTTEEFFFISRNEKFVVLAKGAAFDAFFDNRVIHIEYSQQQKEFVLRFNVYG